MADAYLTPHTSYCFLDSYVGSGLGIALYTRPIPHTLVCVSEYNIQTNIMRNLLQSAGHNSIFRTLLERVKAL